VVKGMGIIAAHAYHRIELDHAKYVPKPDGREPDPPLHSPHSDLLKIWISGI